MSQKQRNYFLDNSSDDLLYREEDDDEEDEKYDDVPYSSSSSVDRSSIGSIPWADDAIRQNQLDWERVERMLSGEEALPDEAELRNEIQEWQRKFPHLVCGVSHKAIVPPPTQPIFANSQSNREDSLEIDDCISNLSLDSLEDDDADDDKYDGFATPTNNNTNMETCNERQCFALEADDLRTPTNRSHRQALGDVAYLLDKELHISSMPMTIRQRREASRNSAQNFVQRRLSATTASSSLPPTPTPTPMPLKRSPKPLIAASSSPTPVKVTLNSAKVTQTALYMPPILNALDTRRRFRGPNRSFVQLTQIQQAKSAAATHQAERRAFAGQVSLAWHTAPRFLNNRNSIILPAINLQRIHEQATPNASSLGSGGASGRRQYMFAPQSHGFGTNSITVNTTPSTAGRSVSAAVHHPRTELSSYYLPYSGNQFKVFK